MDVWMMFSARSASRSSMTHEMLISLAPGKEKSVSSRLQIDNKTRPGALTLRDHFDVNIIITKSREHASCNSDHILHLFSDKTENGHSRDDVDCSVLLQVTQGTLEILVNDLVFISAHSV